MVRQIEKKNVMSVLKYHKQEKLLIDAVIGQILLRQQEQLQNEKLNLPQKVA